MDARAERCDTNAPLIRCLWVIVIAAIASALAAELTTAIGVPRSAVKITGDVKYYESKADSGSLTKRAFCPNCGSRLFSMPPFAPDLMVLTASSLDDPSIFKPAMDIYTSSAQPWDHMNASLPKFPKMPPTGRKDRRL